MKAPLPNWSRWLALGAGLMDAGTGTGLVLLPELTLRLMGVAPPVGEALDFARFVGVFVGAVGLCYLVAWQRGEPGLRVVFDYARIFRGGAGLFTGAMVLVADWAPAWLAVTLTDLGLVAVQSWLLATYRDD